MDSSIKRSVHPNYLFLKQIHYFFLSAFKSNDPVTLNKVSVVFMGTFYFDLKQFQQKHPRKVCDLVRVINQSSA